MKKDSIIKNIKALILGLIVVLGTGYVFASFSDPTCLPTGCNTPPPVTVGGSADVKEGRLAIGTSDLSSLSSYYFSAQNGLSYIQALVTNGFSLIDGSESDGYVLTAVDDTGLATWTNYASSLPSSKMYVDDFNLYVKRNAGTVSATISSDYQYCAISQMGPDYANSDNTPSECSVNKNGNGTWTLKGQRADDPGFWCNVRCFSMDKVPTIAPVVNPTVPVATIQYYCLKTDIVNNTGNSQYDGVNFGCSTAQSFDPTTVPLFEMFTKNDAISGGYGQDFASAYADFYRNTRRSFADQTCGAGNWTINPVGANENLYATGFKCN